MIRFIFLLLLIVDAISCWSGQLPFFTGMVEPGNEQSNEYLAEYGGQLECRFKHEPLRYSTAQDGSYFVIFDSTNMTNSSEIEKLSLRFNRVEQTPITRKVMLLESSLKADKTTFPIPGANRYVYAYKVEGAITIYSLDLLKSQTYSCCVESRENSTTGSICAYLKFKQDRTDQKNEEDEQSDEVAIDTTTPSTSELDFIARNNTLYKVIMILLVSIFVLLLVMFALCLRFSLDDGSLSYRGRRSHRTTTVRSPTSPQLFTVSVPGQASMPKLSIARGDLYSRYNLNNTSVSIVDEPQAAVRTLSDECLPPPPPYAELAAFQKSRSLSG